MSVSDRAAGEKMQESARTLALRELIGVEEGLYSPDIGYRDVVGA